MGAPAHPDWVERMNRMGRVLDEVGVPRLSLDPDELRRQAMQRTGLSDFGPDDYREPFELLCRSLEDEADLHFVGRMVTHDEMLNALETRLRVTDVVKTYPEILDVEIREPVFVCGAGRGGTSILQEVLAAAPGMRSPLGWEAREPCPPPEAATHATDPRRESTADIARMWHWMAPETEAMHAMGATIPMEDTYLLTPAFRHDWWPSTASVPSYTAWLYGGADRTESYRWEKQVLQVLQWKMPTGRWVLKSPMHVMHLPAIFTVFPDAKIIRCHRDPLRTMASARSLVASLQSMRSDAPNMAVVAAPADPALYAAGTEGYVPLWRQQGIVHEGNLFDWVYLRFKADPLGVMREVYDAFGWAFDDATAAAMAGHLEARPQTKFGSHAYSTDLGIDVAAFREALRPYQERYGIESEL